MKVLHIITSVRLGGTQIVLQNLLRRRSYDAEVISLLPEPTVAPSFQALGVPVHLLDLHRPWQLARLGRLIGRSRADLVQTWMHHADFFGGIMTRGAPVIWNIRSSRLAAGSSPLTSRLIMKGCALVSGRVPARIVCGSEAARRTHAAIGYAEEKMLVIPNGIDTDLFHPDPEQRSTVRRELGLPDDAVLVGLVGRFTPAKDHRTFVGAARELLERRADAHFLMCGDNITRENNALAAMIREAGIGANVHLLGRRSDVPSLTAAFDVACMSSSAEGFPNVVAEAMACGIPVVATDVGDASMIVGDCGTVVRPRDPLALAEACVRMLEGPRDIGTRARRRIETLYSIDSMVSRYHALYRETIAASLGSVVDSSQA